MPENRAIGKRYELPGAIYEGGRNSELYRYASSLQAKGRTDNDIERLVNEANQTRCRPSLDTREATEIAHSVCRRYDKGLSPAYSELNAEPIEDASAPAPFPSGDLAMSREFARRNKNRLRYVIEANTWYCYDGTRWVKDPKEPESLMKAFVDEMAQEAKRIPDEAQRAAAQKGIIGYSSFTKRKNLLNDAEAELCAHASEFDARKELFNCRNGTLNTDTLELQPHAPADLLTKLAGCEYSPTANCDEWLLFLEQTFADESGDPDRDRIVFLQRAMGAALACDTSLERMYIAQGQTRTGKSTLIETVRAVFGDYAITAQPETFEAHRRNPSSTSEDLAAFEAVRFVSVPEPRKGMLFDAAFVKRMTGGDTLTATRKYESPRSFRPHCSVWLNCNDLPDVNDQSLFEGGRIVIIPFENRLTEDARDLKMKERFGKPEFLSGVLNWLVIGCATRGEMGFTLPDECTEILAKYKNSSDKVGQFISERCKLGGDGAQGKALYSAYRNWCEEGGYAALSNQNFYKEIEKRAGVRRIEQKKIEKHVVKGWFEGIELVSLPA